MVEGAVDSESVLVGDVERFIQEAVEQLGPVRRAGSVGRPEVLPGLCLWTGLLICVVRGWSSQTAVWRLLTQWGLWSYARVTVTSEAVYQRLGRSGTAPLERLFEQVTALLMIRLAPYRRDDLAPFASGVVAIDETTLDPVARRLPALRAAAAGDRRLLPGKLAGLFDVRAQCWRRIVHHENPCQNEKRAARELVSTLPKETLILADLGYFGFAWFDWLSARGYWWISRLRAKTSFRVHHVLYQHGEVLDALVWLGAYRADRAKSLVRLVQFRQGGVLRRYITNVLDPRVLSLAGIARLYARRWDIELAIKLAKRELGLHLLWSAKLNVVLQQVWAVLIIAQILQALRIEVAGRAGVDPFEVSLPLMVECLPQIAARGRDPIAFAVAEGRQFGLIRPSRRVRIEAPEIPIEAITLPPPDLVSQRVPRYAGRCGTHRRVTRL